MPYYFDQCGSDMGECDAHVAMVEHVCSAIQIVEALWREDHSNVLAPIKERNCSQEEVWTWDLRIPIPILRQVMMRLICHAAKLS